jgi:protein TonB
MTQYVTKKWGLLSWRLLFVCGLLLLQEWAFAAWVKPSVMGGASGDDRHVSLAISFKPSPKKRVEDLAVVENTAAVMPSDTATPPLKREVSPVPAVSSMPDARVTKSTPIDKRATELSERPKPISKPNASSKIAQAKQDHRPIKTPEVIKKAPTVTPVAQAQGVMQSASLADVKAKAPASTSTQALAGPLNSHETIITKPIFAVQPTPPRYPKVARKRGQEGTVWLDIWLDEKGNKSKLEITQSSGLTLLDQSALKAVSGWKFKPSEKNGIRVASRVRIPVVFSLN